MESLEEFSLAIACLFLSSDSERMPGDGASYDDFDEDDGMDGLDAEDIGEDGRLSCLVYS